MAVFDYTDRESLWNFDFVLVLATQRGMDKF